MREALHWMWLPMRRYAEFSGRSRRREFWVFTIAVMLVGAGLDYLDEAIGLDFDQAGWVLGASGLIGREGTDGPNRFGNDPKAIVDYDGIFD